MDAFMNGEVEYFIAAPAFQQENSESFAVRPLVFRSFSKSDRPRAWKNCDLRIQTTLPVLGIDDSSISKDGDFSGEGSNTSERLIRISMKLRNSNSEE